MCPKGKNFIFSTSPPLLVRICRKQELPCFKFTLLGVFFFNDTATTEIYTLSLHDALPIWWIAEHITLNAPTTAYVSNVTGALATAELVTDPGYWARHMCQPVRFEEGLATALGRTSSAFVEIRPGKSLGAMARSHADCDRSRWPLILATMPAAADAEAGDRALAGALAELWLTGVDVD